MISRHLVISKQILLNFLNRNISKCSWNGDLLENILFDILICLYLASILYHLHKLLKSLYLFPLFDVKSNNELKEMPVCKYLNALSLEKIINIANIPPQEVKSMRMVVFHRLRDINNIYFILPVQHVVLTQICVDQFALLVQNSHYFDHLKIQLAPSLYLFYVSILQPWSIQHVLPYEVHHQHI